MAIAVVTIVDEDASGEVTCYCLKKGNEKKAKTFLDEAIRGDFSAWEKICSSHSEKRGGDALW